LCTCYIPHTSRCIKGCCFITFCCWCYRLIGGLIFVDNINSIAGVIEKITGQEVFDPTVYYFTEIPTIVHPFTLVWVMLGAVGIAVMASVLPAMRAARMHPVQALRFE